MSASCSHLDTIAYTQVPAVVPGCEDCLQIGSRWLHLRMCASCGHIGCCDDSPNRHATAHHRASGHPIVRSAEPGEDWFWCYEDEIVFAVAAEGP
jgi:Zn-finger in ubiquitin-hydrolases and other protein